MKDLIKRNFELIATTVIGAILVATQQAGYSSGLVVGIVIVLLIVAVALRHSLETEGPPNTNQIIIGLILTLIVWVAVYVGVSVSTRVMVKEFEIQKDALATEITAQANMLSTAQAQMAVLNVQKGISLRPNPGNLVETKGDLPLCTTVEYLDEITIDDVVWVNVYSSLLQTDGWVKSDSVSRSRGVCPTPTETPTITPTPSITPTPTKTPSSTSTWTPDQIVWVAINRFYEHINKNELVEAWETLHPDYQAALDQQSWEQSISNKTFRIEINLYNINLDGNTATVSGILYITPDFQEEQHSPKTYCLTRQNPRTQWLIIDILDDEFQDSCKFLEESK